MYVVYVNLQWQTACCKALQVTGSKLPGTGYEDRCWLHAASAFRAV